MTPITTTTDAGMAETEAAVRDALAQQGFGVLTEIDIAATLKEKLGVDGPPLKILGACNPHLAHQALTADPDAALVLPCNVVLDATATGTRVRAADPHDIITSPELSDLADEAAEKLRRALDSITAAASIGDRA
ncbi:MAG: DUF302 domain-containing protein [Acidimicrobiales bacterium]